jgi:hypothetical protein
VIFLESDIAFRKRWFRLLPYQTKAFDNEFCSEPILRNERLSKAGLTVRMSNDFILFNLAAP